MSRQRPQNIITIVYVVVYFMFLSKILLYSWPDKRQESKDAVNKIKIRLCKGGQGNRLNEWV